MYINGRKVDNKLLFDPDPVPPQVRRDFCMLVLKLIQCPDMELRDLHDLLHGNKYILLEEHLKTFHANMEDIYKNGVGSIGGVMQNVKQLMVEPSPLQPAVYKTSIIGLYLRRIVVYFDKLSFSQVVSIYQSFRKYYERAAMKKGVVECKDDTLSSGHEVEMSLCDATSPCPESSEISQSSDKIIVETKLERGCWSRRQAELFIAQQASLIQTDEMSALPPPQLQEKITDLLLANSECGEAHYLSYLNCLRVKEFAGAIHSLFHAFDRNTLISEGKTANQEEKNKGFRYAELNLAMLFAQFSHRQEALSALKEAIMLAHDMNDCVCLQYALAWLYKLTYDNKEGLIERSITKSSDLNLSYLTSLAIQSYAQYAGSSGGKPSLVFDLLMKSDVLNCQHSMIDLLSNSYAQKAALWCLYGKTEMASLSSQLLLHLNTSNPTQGLVAYNGEAICVAICNVVNILAEQGEYHLASRILYNAQERFPHEPMAHSWIFSQQLLCFTEAIHNGKWQDAEQAIAHLAAIDKGECHLRRAELQIAKSNYPAAADCVNAVLEYCRLHAKEDYNCLSLRVRALILAAELQCCSNVATSAPTGAISLLTSALAITQIHFLDYLTAIVSLHLAKLQLQMGLPNQALKLINESLLVILSHGSYFDQARALVLYAECKVAAAANLPEEARNSAILEAIQMLNKSKSNFLKVEAYSRVKDVLYLQVLLYNELGYVSERKKCALEFRQWDGQYPVKISTTLLTRL
ncbi:anaphase-promoting complex subunit 5 isoform X2 [Anabrus simplex]|uniref:anaphase-promoting complex subunit 5 isoform X2 n=1 Tax=Anabrus simplex TaxID=316456 RepID=UPI0035A2A5BB